MQFGMNMAFGGQAGVGKPGPSGPPPVAPLLMSGRANPPGFNGYAGSSTTDLNSNSRISFYNETGATVTKLKALFPNWMLNANNEAAGFNTITVSAALEYPAGVFTPLTFGGASSVAIAVDGLTPTDELTTSIPADAQFWIRTYVVVGSGLKWPQGYLINTARGEAADFATGVDKTGGATITNAAATATRRGYGPAAVVATAFTGTPVKVAIFGFGDSIQAGTTFGVVDLRGSVGYTGNACENRVPFLNCGYSGLRAALQPGNMARRLALAAACGVTHACINLGLNDVSAGATAVALLADLNSVWTGFNALGIKPAQATITPSTTSTDNWDTRANQTVAGGGFAGGAASVRGVVNAGIRSKPAPLFDVIETADAVEFARDDGKWKTEADAAGTTHLLSSVLCTVDGVSTTTVLDIGVQAQLGTNLYAFGGQLVAVTGPNAGERRAIASNGTGTITVSVAFTNVPQVGETYRAYSTRGRVAADGYHPAGIITPPGYGGNYMMGDAVINRITEWAA